MLAHHLCESVLGRYKRGDCEWRLRCLSTAAQTTAAQIEHIRRSIQLCVSALPVEDILSSAASFGDRKRADVIRRRV